MEPREPQEEPQNDDIVISDEDYEGHFFATELPADSYASESKQTMGMMGHRVFMTPKMNQAME
jgi:hypothetical protein